LEEVETTLNSSVANDTASSKVGLSDLSPCGISILTDCIRLELFVHLAKQQLGKKLPYLLPRRNEEESGRHERKTYRVNSEKMGLTPMMPGVQNWKIAKRLKGSQENLRELHLVMF